MIVLDIKEVEKLLGCPSANIRYYEKEGLIQPGRKENKYRNFEQEDVALLQKILVLRKLGFTLQEIRSMQNKELTLQDAADENIARLEKEIEELKGSLKYAKQLQAEKTTFFDMDEGKYWQSISNAEEKGESFIDACRDYLQFEAGLFDTMWKWVFFFDFKDVRQKRGMVIAVLMLLALCIVRGISKVFWQQGSFWQGFSYPFFIFVAASLVILPLYILSKKAPRVASVIAMVMLIACVLFLATVIVGLVVLLLNAVFHFWY